MFSFDVAVGRGAVPPLCAFGGIYLLRRYPYFRSFRLFSPFSIVTAGPLLEPVRCKCSLSSPLCRPPYACNPRCNCRGNGGTKDERALVDHLLFCSKLFARNIS